MPRLLGMDLRGHLDLLLLATLRDDGPAHGYAIIASLRERSLGAFDLPDRPFPPAGRRCRAPAHGGNGLSGLLPAAAPRPHGPWPGCPLTPPPPPLSPPHSLRP